MPNNKIPASGIVYSTDPDFKPGFKKTASSITPAPGNQKLVLRLDKKHRGGKAVTLIEGFIGTTTDKETLGKNLKTFCGTGGAVKDGEIMVQGDNREKIFQWLLKYGYTNVKK